MTTSALLSVIVVITIVLVIGAPGVAGLLLGLRKSESETVEVMNRIQVQQALQLEEYSHRIDNVTKRLNWALERIGYLERGIAALSAQVERLGDSPVWKPDPTLPPPPPENEGGGRVYSPAATEELLGRLVSQFTLDELADLALAVGFELEDVPGSTRRAKARGLIEATRDRGLLDDLIAAARKARPRSSWEL